MFDFFTRHTAKDLVKDAEKLYDMPLSSIKKIQSQEYVLDELFRVGSTSLGETTLTLMTPDGMSMTITMNQTTCEQLIRMLRATYYDEEPTEGDTNG
jgi:hypothetical protein